MTHSSNGPTAKIRFLFSFIFRLVSGAGDIKITKDGNVLLHEMQIQHPTASLIARASTAQDDMTGDGTTSTVLLIGELLKQADILLCEGVHPRILTDGFDLGRARALEILDTMKIPIEVGIAHEQYLFAHGIRQAKNETSLKLFHFNYSQPKTVSSMLHVLHCAPRCIHR